MKGSVMRNYNAKIVSLLIVLSILLTGRSFATTIAQSPLFLTENVPPIVMLTMGRDHKLYYEAYNDASDINGDGELDIRYKPDEIDYFGYFDSYKCYNYSSGKFVPSSATATATKQCSGNWSGDFLNYVTMSRMDALRKVLYGGFRSSDTTSETILKRTFLPQDAHSWGKEYTSVALDGYDISDYTPLSIPNTGTRHLFANVSLSSSGQPLMRVLNDTIYRVWEWVSIERPVAGTKCINQSTDCAAVGGSSWVTVPSTVLLNLDRTTYDLSGTGFSHPSNHSEYDTLVTTYATAGRKFGNGSMSTIEGTDNPYGSNDDYLTVVTGSIVIPVNGTYTFSVDGDDAVEVIINNLYVAGYYGDHAECNCNTHTVTATLAAGTYPIEFRHEEAGGGDNFALRWNQVLPTSTIADYDVNVEVCKTGLLEGNCKAYSDGSTTTYKPTGVLQRYGDDELMAFGLLTSSYHKNTSGGVLRKNISSFQDEIDLDTGIFTNTTGIVDTIDKLKIARFRYPSTSNYDYQSGWITTRAINESEAQDWGNPVAEMMYEGLRYFAGKSGPTTEYSSGVSTGTDTTVLNLPLPSWEDPYRTTSGGYESCAKPMQMVISDINSSYDSDQLPGSYFDNTFTGDLTGMNVSTLADTIWAGESEDTNIFIGESGTDDDGTPSPKTVTSFSNIRGLAPEEPTKLGSYYAGSVALYGQQTDIHTITGDQNVDTIAVAIASPLPRIEIPISGKTVTLVPFAKSVGGASISNAEGDFQPTNQIVDFYVETIVNTGAGNTNVAVNAGRPYGKFRINYEDVEQAADHDMDAIVEYEFTVDASNQLLVSLNSTYAAGGIIQHMGYVISGTTADGTYLEVRDVDTSAGSDPDYFLDTPPGQLPGGTWNDSTELPLSTSRTFTVGTTNSASFIKHDPLWYAAKWSMADEDGSGTLDADEWDSDSDGDPDGYFLVTNAGDLEQQLESAFNEIVARTSSAAAVATNSTRLDANAKVYQARFNTTDWTGQFFAYDLDDSNGSVSTLLWDAATLIPSESTRKIFTYNPSTDAGITFDFSNIDDNGSTQETSLDTDSDGTVDSLAEERIAYLRGDQSDEIQNGGTFRDRSSLMGDIVNSDPWFVGRTGDFGYSRLSGTEGSSYITFKSTKLSRTPALYFGANDGMFHAINADTGNELFNYVPDTIMSTLSKLTSPLYGCTTSGCIPHSYFVDGPSKAADAYIDSGDGDAWNTILVGTLGGGGQGIFALDVTTPSTFAAADVLWEVSTTQADSSGDLTDFQNNLGYTLTQASIVRMHNNKWAAIVSNGYDSTSKNAVLFILDLETGEIIKMIDTGVGGSGTPNGLSTPTAIDEDGDRIVDSIYAGDLQGNLWKFDVTGSNTNQWDVADVVTGGSADDPLFVAKDSGDVVQPITAKPQVGKHPDGGFMIYFGTGKYYAVNDQIVGATPQVQTFYGIRDEGSQVTDRTELQQQQILYEATLSSLSLSVRVTSDTQVDYTTKNGWYLDLQSPVNGAEGERSVSAPLLRDGRIIFATLIPNSDPCGWGGESWLMELDAVNGNLLSTSPFDIDEDGDFDADDMLNTMDTDGDGDVDADDRVAISGVKKDGVGIFKTPGVISADDKTEVKYVSGNSGNLAKFNESAGDPIGRQSWLQIQ